MRRIVTYKVSGWLHRVLGLLNSRGIAIAGYTLSSRVDETVVEERDAVHLANQLPCFQKLN